MYTLEELAVATINAQRNGYSITANDVATLLKDVKGTTFASIITVTKVATAAAHKSEQIHKVTTATVQLFNNVSEFTSVYERAVKRSAAKLNSEAEVAHFQTQDTYFFHTDCYSVVQHKTDASKQYLYAIYNNAKSVYVRNDRIISKEDAATYCTPSAQKEMLKTDTTVHNVNNDVTHDVVVRTIGLASIVQLNAMKQSLTV